MGAEVLGDENVYVEVVERQRVSLDELEREVEELRIQRKKEQETILKQRDEIEVLARALELKAEDIGNGCKDSFLRTLAKMKRENEDVQDLKKQLEKVILQKEELEFVRESNNQELMKCEKTIKEILKKNELITERNEQL